MEEIVAHSLIVLTGHPAASAATDDCEVEPHVRLGPAQVTNKFTNP